MMVEATRLSEALQSLVDARLDTVDRMLLGRVNRQDRLAIVREVESQVFDLIDRQGSADLDREEILAILGRLDPPEAYLPEEATEMSGGSAGRAAYRLVAPVSHVKARAGRASFASGGLGLTSIGMLLAAVLTLVTEGSIQSEAIAIVLLIGITGSLFLSSLLAIVLSAYTRFQGPWSITGLVTGLFSLVSGSAMVMYVISLSS